MSESLHPYTQGTYCLLLEVWPWSTGVNAGRECMDTDCILSTMDTM